MNRISTIIQTILGWFLMRTCISQYDKRLVWSVFVTLCFLEHLIHGGERQVISVIGDKVQDCKD